MTPWQSGPAPQPVRSKKTPMIRAIVLATVLGALVTSLSSVVGVWLMRRSGEDRATAFFSSMPGGSGEMVNPRHVLLRSVLCDVNHILAGPPEYGRARR